MPNKLNDLARSEQTSAALADSRTYVAFIATAIFAGGNAVAIKVANQELPPFWNAAVRFLAAAVILAGAIAILRLALPRGKALLGVVLYGLLNFGLAFMFIYWALREVTAGTTMVVLATVPILTLIFAIVVRIENFSVRGSAGAIVAAIGIGVIFGDSISAASPGTLAALLAGAACLAAAPIVVKTFPRVHGVVENGLGMLVGGSWLLALSLAAGEARAFPVEVDTYLSLLYLVLVGSIGLFLLYMFVLRRMAASGAMYIMLLAPLAAVALGALILGETINAAFIVGAALVVFGVYFGVTGHARRSNSRNV